MIRHQFSIIAAIALFVFHTAPAVALDSSVSVLDQLKAAGAPIVLVAAEGNGDCSDSVRRCYNACYQEVRSAGGAEHTGSYETSPCKAGCKIQFGMDGDLKGYHAYCTGASPQIHTVGDCSDSVRRCYNACYQEVRRAGGAEHTGSYESSPCKAGCEIQFNPENDVPGYHAQCTGK